MSDSTNEFTHLSGSDLPRMIDISEKTVTERKAVAVARVHLGAELAELLRVVDIELEEEYALIKVTAKTTGRTGVEMEALTAASVAALTFYDMCKSVTKCMVIESVYLLEKTGGKSGDYRKKD